MFHVYLSILRYVCFTYISLYLGIYFRYHSILRYILGIALYLGMYFRYIWLHVFVNKEVSELNGQL